MTTVSDKKHYVNSGSPGFRFRLSKALAWCKWRERTGVWPAGEVVHSTDESAAPRIESRQKSRGILEVSDVD